jgi:hypothetical protein
MINALPSHGRDVAALVQGFPESLDLVRTNLALGVCIACAGRWDTLRGEATELTVRLLRMRRREACAALGFPGTEATVRLLAKILPEACSVPVLMRLRRKLAEPGLAETLRHLPVIGKEALFLAANWRWGGSVSIPLFREMERQSDGAALPKYGSLLEDTVQMRERLDRNGRPFRNLAEVKRCHDRLAADVNYGANGRDSWVLDLQFPPPPIPGTERILALDSPSLLIDEGRKQHHCVAIKAEEVASGQMYVYRILAPEGRGATIDVDAEGYEGAFTRTAGLIAESQEPIFEAAFRVDGALAFADVMLPKMEQGRLVWGMFEVKSSTSVKDYHHDDIAVQTFLAQAAGVPLASVAVAHLDHSWVYPGDEDYRGLLIENDLTMQALARTEEVRGWIAEAQGIVARDAPPEITVGPNATPLLIADSATIATGTLLTRNIPWTGCRASLVRSVRSLSNRAWTIFAASLMSC